MKKKYLRKKFEDLLEYIGIPPSISKTPDKLDFIYMAVKNLERDVFGKVDK